MRYCGKSANKNAACFVMESYFMMGSMGSAVGEKITSLFEYATEHRLPVIGFTVSGGARMQEGLLSLMQMAKTSAAVKRHSDAGLFIYCRHHRSHHRRCDVLCHGGGYILAEPGATVGLLVKQVIEQTTKKVAAKKVSKANFVLEHGFVDNIVPRSNQKKI